MLGIHLVCYLSIQNKKKYIFNSNKKNYIYIYIYTGGAVWRISKEIESIVYAIDINHAKERHLNPTLLNTLKKPALMICGVRNPLHLNKCINISSKPNKNNTNTRVNIEKDIISTVLSTLRSGGDVLFPTDSSTRLLELLLFFDQEW